MCSKCHPPKQECCKPKCCEHKRKCCKNRCHQYEPKCCCPPVVIMYANPPFDHRGVSGSFSSGPYLTQSYGIIY